MASRDCIHYREWHS